jgi:hypothetical protein
MLSRVLCNLQLIWKIGLLTYLRGRLQFRRSYLQVRDDIGYRYVCLSGQYKRGRLKVFAEARAEGLVWAACEDGKRGCEGLNLLRPGDHLTIFGHDGEVLFQGPIDPDREIKSHWWTQRGWKPEDWVELFFQPVPYRVLLLKKNVPWQAWLIKVQSQPPIDVTPRKP